MESISYFGRVNPPPSPPQPSPDTGMQTIQKSRDAESQLISCVVTLEINLLLQLSATMPAQKVKLPALKEIMTDKPTNNQPPNRSTDRLGHRESFAYNNTCQS